MSVLLRASLILCTMYVDSILGEEPHFQNYYNLMQKVLDLEQQLKQNTDAVLLLEQRNLLERVSTHGESGSVYTRWGRNVCDGDASVVYTGYIAGRKYSDTGSGSDSLCLPSDPSWLNYTEGVGDLRGYVYGSEIHVHDADGISAYPLHTQDLPCSVCMTSKRTVLMIPGRSSCYSGWTQEYQGYLMAQYHGHPSPDNHICVDARPEFVPNGAKPNSEHVLYFIEARCGSLPCPPYVDGRELACVVCSI